MPKGPDGERRPADVIGAAVMVGKIATGEIEEPKVAPKSAAAELGSRAGRRGRQSYQSRTERKYSPGICTSVYGKKVTGNPDARHVSTSHVESHNQKMRAHTRRFTRLTAGHSKKFANHCHALAIYFAYYNFVKVHSSLRMSPAMAAGIETRLWNMSDIVALVDARAEKPNRPATYRKRAQ